MPQYPEVSLYTQRQWENQANRDLDVTPTPRKSQEGDQNHGKEGEAVHGKHQELSLLLDGGKIVACS